ncbi:hypothetical protein [Okeania sp. KiyG1]|uniref:hypothetical protein n=1 Tax=Okeania sp. KiyG1 TaxID=2720165 RepID=UPI0019207DED|nr:hypothetical protein [Okeania sp. KiyG1]GGA49396.1 hypothetical protein CYANOKiyG1_68590 [Okeania sp. KiyG1]
MFDRSLGGIISGENKISKEIFSGIYYLGISSCWTYPELYNHTEKKSEIWYVGEPPANESKVSIQQSAISYQLLLLV